MNPRRQYFDVELLLQDQRTMDFVDTNGTHCSARKRLGCSEERWVELKKSVLESAQKYLQGRCKKQRKWLTENTIKIF